MNTQDQLAAKIASVKAELAKLENEKGMFDGLTLSQQLATELHNLRCTWNHTDGCTWFYETVWSDYTRASYLKKADNILMVTDLETALKVLKLAQSFN